MQIKIGVIQKRSEPAFPLPRTVEASHGFAARIAGRYLASDRTVSRAELALAYQAAGEVNYFQETCFDISPRVDFHDHHLFAPVQRETATAAAERDDRGTPVARLFERLFSRHTRVTSFQAGASPTTEELRANDRREQRPMPGFSIERPQPVERIVRASAPQLSKQRPEQPAAPRSSAMDHGWGSPMTPPPATKPLTLPPAEVKRVTDEVIREIDHRIISRRERMGKR